MACNIAAQNPVRITACLPLGSLEILRQLAAAQNVTLTEAMRRAIATEGFLKARIASGSKLLLEREDGTATEIRFAV
jgi:hypothetical protein